MPRKWRLCGGSLASPWRGANGRGGVNIKPMNKTRIVELRQEQRVRCGPRPRCYKTARMAAAYAR